MASVHPKLTSAYSPLRKKLGYSSAKKDSVDSHKLAQRAKHV